MDVAFRVLAEAGEPLTVADITDRGLSKGWLKTSGKTPMQTMKSKLSTDILRRKGQSPFMRTAKGEFGLREWKHSPHQEFIADRYKRALLDEEIVVFPAASLPKYVPGSGLYPDALQNGWDLLAECNPMQRRVAEEDYSVIQLVSVFIVKYQSSYLTYKRTKRLPENRLHGAYSLVFGGHLNFTDIPPLFDIFRPEFGARFLQRELSEEVVLPRERPPTLRYRGLLYDSSRALSSQHLGIVYDVLLSNDEYQIGERGFLIDAKFETLDQIEGHLDDFENWSVLIARCERAQATERGG